MGSAPRRRRHSATLPCFPSTPANPLPCRQLNASAARSAHRPLHEPSRAVTRNTQPAASKVRRHGHARGRGDSKGGRPGQRAAEQTPAMAIALSCDFHLAPGGIGRPACLRSARREMLTGRAAAAAAQLPLGRRLGRRALVPPPFGHPAPHTDRSHTQHSSPVAHRPPLCCSMPGVPAPAAEANGAAPASGKSVAFGSTTNLMAEATPAAAPLPATHLHAPTDGKVRAMGRSWYACMQMPPALPPCTRAPPCTPPWLLAKAAPDAACSPGRRRHERPRRQQLAVHLTLACSLARRPSP